MNRNRVLYFLVVSSCVFAGADQPKKETAKRASDAPMIVDLMPTSRGLAEQSGRANAYRGTTSAPHPEAAGAALTLQQQVGKTLSKLDQVPQQRLRHFAWVSEVNAKINAWHLQVESAEPIPGGWRAQVHVMPNLNPSSAMFTNDRLTETYEYRGGKLTLIDIAEPTEPRYTVQH